MTGRLLMAAVPVLVLAGCAPGSVQPSATADSVLQVQYRATAAHGAMSGQEATRITDSYDRQIGADVPAQSSVLSSDRGRYAPTSMPADR